MSKWPLTILFCYLLPTLVHAHKPSDSYLTLQNDGSRWDVSWEIALRDLNSAIGLDINQDRQLTKAEVQSQAGEITNYSLARLRIGTGSETCEKTASGFEIRSRNDEHYAAITFDARCDSIEAPQLHYTLFFDIDPTHTGLVQIKTDKNINAFVLSNEQRTLDLSTTTPNTGQSLLSMFRDGVWHIWIGFDHILFLLTLLLPTVLVFRQNRWQAA